MYFYCFKYYFSPKFSFDLLTSKTLLCSHQIYMSFFKIDELYNCCRIKREYIIINEFIHVCYNYKLIF